MTDLSKLLLLQLKRLQITYKRSCSFDNFLAPVFLFFLEKYFSLYVVLVFIFEKETNFYFSFTQILVWLEFFTL